MSKDSTDLLVKPSQEVLRVMVHYGSLPKMVKSARFDKIYDDVASKKFPIEKKERGKVDTELILVHLNRVVYVNEALQELKNLGLRPANIAELLALAKKYPDKQKEFPIVALGASCKNPPSSRTHYAFLRELYGKRYIGLDPIEDPGFRSECRFLAVLE